VAHFTGFNEAKISTKLSSAFLISGLDSPKTVSSTAGG